MVLVQSRTEFMAMQHAICTAD